MEFSEKQIHILNTAEKLFAESGYEGTSVRDIAVKADVNVAMISYYFGSKKELMQALFERKSLHIELRVEKLLQDDSLSAFQKIEILVDDYTERMMSNQQFFKIMICEQVINKNGQLLDLITALRLRNAEAITKLLRHGQKSGEFKKNIDVAMMMNTLVGTSSQLMISQEFYKTFHKLQELNAEQFRLQLLKKIRIHIKNIFKMMLTHEA